MRAVLEGGPKTSTGFTVVRLIGIEIARGRLRAAGVELDRFIAVADELKLANFKARTLSVGAALDSLAGRPERALEKIEAALKINRELDLWPQIRVLLAQKGLVYLRMGSLDGAVKVAQELREFINQGLNKRAGRYADLLDGNIELKKGNSQAAVELLERAAALLPHQAGILDEHANFLENLAAAYEAAGNLEKARETYEKITGLTTGRLFYGPVYALAFSNLGRIAEKQGDKAQARLNYQRFLDLMKNADPGFLQVDEFKKRLAGLGS